MLKKENKLRLITLATALCLLLPSFAWAYGLPLGTSAPDFRAVSGDNQPIVLKDIKGKVTGIFYETTDVTKENIELKNELGKYYVAQPEDIRALIMRLPVINCSKVFKLLAGVYRSEFRKYSKTEGITIYADWSGKMFSDYKIEDGKSNVFLVDKKGIIRYYAAGKITGQEMAGFLALFKKLIEE